MSNRFINNYPSGYTYFPEMYDHIDAVDHGYFEGLHNEIYNIEYILGLSPQGSYSTVKDRLDDTVKKSGDVMQGILDLNGYPAEKMRVENRATFPETAGTGYLFWHTEYDKGYARGASDWYVFAGADGAPGYKYATKVVHPTGDQADTYDIQTALNAASAAGGGVVLLREGTYWINANLEMKSNVILRGMGDATIIKRNTDAVTKMINCATSVARFTIENLVLDGYEAQYPNNVHGIYIVNAYKVIIRNIRTEGIDDDGIHVEQGYQIRIENCRLYGCGDNGIYLGGNEDDIWITHNLIDQPFNNGIKIESGTKTGIRIIDNHINSPEQYGIWTNVWDEHNEETGNRISGATTGDIYDSTGRLVKDGRRERYFAWLTPGSAVLDTSGGNYPELIKNVGTNWQAFVLAFDKDVNEICYWHLPVSENYHNKKLRFTIHWMANAVSGSARWKITYRCPIADNLWDSQTTPTQREVDVDGAVGAAAWALRKTNIDMSYDFPKRGGNLQVKLMRYATHGNDTLATDAQVLGIGVEEVMDQ